MGLHLPSFQYTHTHTQVYIHIYTHICVHIHIYVDTDHCLSIGQGKLENVPQALFLVSWCHFSYGGWDLIIIIIIKSDTSMEDKKSWALVQLKDLQSCWCCNLSLKTPNKISYLFLSPLMIPKYTWITVKQNLFSLIKQGNNHNWKALKCEPTTSPFPGHLWYVEYVSWLLMNSLNYYILLSVSVYLYYVALEMTACIIVNKHMYDSGPRKTLFWKI